MPYMVEHDGRVLGPFSLEELGQQVATGRITPSDLGCDQGAGHWLPVAQIISVQPTAPPPPPVQTVASGSASQASLFKLGFSILGSALVIWRILVFVHRLSHLPHPQ